MSNLLKVIRGFGRRLDTVFDRFGWCFHQCPNIFGSIYANLPPLVLYRRY